LATDLTAKVEGDANNKWLLKSNEATATSKFYAVGTKAKISDQTQANPAEEKKNYKKTSRNVNRNKRNKIDHNKTYNR
jgi:hypothetical protein